MSENKLVNKKVTYSLFKDGKLYIVDHITYFLNRYISQNCLINGMF